MTDTENTTEPSGEDGDLTVAELARRLDRTPEQVRNHADNLEAAIVGFQSYRTAGCSVLTRNAVKRITRTVKAAREIAALETDLNSIHGPAPELDRSPAPQGITVAGLARELDVSMDQAVGLVTDAGAPQPTDWYGTDVIAPEIADLARRLHRDTDPERPLFGVTPGVLARELGVVPEWLDGYVSSLLEEGRLVVWTDRGVLSAAAADEIRTLVRSEKIPDTSVGNLMTELGVSPKDIVEWVLVARRTLGDAAVHGPFDRSDPFWGETLTGAAADAIRTWARQQVSAEKTENTGEQPYDGGMAGCDRIDAHGPHRGTSSMAVSGVEHATAWRCEGKQAPGILITDPAQLPASGLCSVPGQPREAAQAASPDPEDVAELLIRQDMALSAVDDGPERIPEDTAVLEWAVRTAGHRFDPHTLWDYDLITDDQHVHRCLDHRHVGPNTRGPVRRGQ